MEKISYTGEFVCPKCGRHTALVCHIDGTCQAHCLRCNAYYDVEIAKQTNADRIRAMTDEELADELLEWFACFMAVEWSRDMILDYLKQEAKE